MLACLKPLYARQGLELAKEALKRLGLRWK